MTNDMLRIPSKTSFRDKDNSVGAIWEFLLRPSGQIFLPISLPPFKDKFSKVIWGSQYTAFDIICFLNKFATTNLSYWWAKMIVKTVLPTCLTKPVQMKSWLPPVTTLPHCSVTRHFSYSAWNHIVGHHRCRKEKVHNTFLTLRKSGLLWNLLSATVATQSYLLAHGASNFWRLCIYY